MSVQSANPARRRQFGTYEIVDAGRWTVECGPAGAAFLHELAHPAGYSYRYRKCLRLVQDSPELRIEHSLNNTGTRAIDVWQYYHNFFLIDGRVSGPGLTVLFRFPPLHSSALDGAVRVRGDAGARGRRDLPRDPQSLRRPQG